MNTEEEIDQLIAEEDKAVKRGDLLSQCIREEKEKQMKHIPLTQGQHAIVDNEDYEELSKHKWYALKAWGGFVAVRKASCSTGKQKMIFMHRQIMNAPEGMNVDHINHEPLDNRKENLRVCTHQQNMQNQLSYKNSSSKYKGVTWHKRDKKWQAYIAVNGNPTYLGLFNNEKGAAKAYDTAAECFGEFAHLNFGKGETI